MGKHVAWRLVHNGCSSMPVILLLNFREIIKAKPYVINGGIVKCEI